MGAPYLNSLARLLDMATAVKSSLHAAGRCHGGAWQLPRLLRGVVAGQRAPRRQAPRSSRFRQTHAIPAYFQPAGCRHAASRVPDRVENAGRQAHSAGHNAQRDARTSFAMSRALGSPRARADTTPRMGLHAQRGSGAAAAAAVPTRAALPRGGRLGCIHQRVRQHIGACRLLLPPLSLAQQGLPSQHGRPCLPAAPPTPAPPKPLGVAAVRCRPSPCPPC
jgi:hypothetical protein